jgi:hypothetical protein
LYCQLLDDLTVNQRLQREMYFGGLLPEIGEANPQHGDGRIIAGHSFIQFGPPQPGCIGFLLVN